MEIYIYRERESFSFFVNTCWYCTNADAEFLRGSPDGVHVSGEGQKRNEPFFLFVQNEIFEAMIC